MLNAAMYREHAISRDLQSAVACTWEHWSQEAGNAYVVPDACVDILWNGEQLMVAGPDTRALVLELRANTRICGIRFLPGAAGTLLGVPARAVRDARVELRDLWGEHARVLQEQLAACSSSSQRLAQLEAAVTQRVHESGEIDPLARSIVAALRPSPELACAAVTDDPGSVVSAAPVPSVAQLSAALGVSERQLLRRCDAAFGYGPKLLARVLRFQAFVRALRLQPQLGLAELASSLGYADQAHLAHETAELAGRTPSQLR